MALFCCRGRARWVRPRCFGVLGNAECVGPRRARPAGQASWYVERLVESAIATRTGKTIKHAVLHPI